jgi:RimJ/RimL family protein N-acetyltransferase
LATILETERLLLRELNSETDADFIFELLNTPKFKKFIGDRGVGSAEGAVDFIETKYRQSYRDHGYGLYAVEDKSTGTSLGLCGFVRRDTLPGPDIGFAFLPQFERKGYGFESAKAVMTYGKDTLGFTQLFAITSQDNDVSGRLLEKLGFKFDKIVSMPNGEELKLFEREL